MKHSEFKTGLKVVYKGKQVYGKDTSPELEGCVGIVDRGLPCSSDTCIGMGHGTWVACSVCTYGTYSH